jgi:hypothetical protein
VLRQPGRLRVGLRGAGLWDGGYAACSAFQNTRIRAE